MLFSAGNQFPEIGMSLKSCSEAPARVFAPRSGLVWRQLFFSAVGVIRLIVLQTGLAPARGTVTLRKTIIPNTSDMRGQDNPWIQAGSCMLIKISQRMCVQYVCVMSVCLCNKCV